MLLGDLGWLIAGLVTLAFGAYTGSTPICSCPEIHANATSAQIAQICHCGVGTAYIGGAYAYVGTVAALVGFMLALLHRRIAGYA